MPWPAQARSIIGRLKAVDKQVIHPLIIGFFFSNLSPIIPANKLLVKPPNVSIKAFNAAYYALNPGYILRKKTGKNEAIMASEKCLHVPASVINLVVGLATTSANDPFNFYKNDLSSFSSSLNSKSAWFSAAAFFYSNFLSLAMKLVNKPIPTPKAPMTP